MYESFFELSQRPFAPHPLTSRYFPGSAIESARATLVRCIERAEGAALIVGASGTGKTMLCYLLAEHFRQQFAQAMLFSGHLSSRQDLLRAILFELGLPYRGLDEGELRLSLIDFLVRSDDGSRGLLLIIDEAHTLPLRLLEEIRMITNLVRNGQPQVRLVLAGGPALEEHFASPKLESFSQRLAARCYLEPLDRQESLDYIRSQLRAVSADPARIFTDAALEAVYRATDGIPRLINQVCDHALVLAKTAGKRLLNAPEIETAWADLQQLPMPWKDTAAQSGSATTVNVVEFGDLEDEFFAPGPELRLALPPSELHDDELAHAEPSADASDDLDTVTATEGRLDRITEQWDLLESDFLGGGDAGLPEVELVFDEASDEDVACESNSLVALSYTNAAEQFRLDEPAADVSNAEPAMEADEPLSLNLPSAPVAQHQECDLEDQPWVRIEDMLERIAYGHELLSAARPMEQAQVIHDESTGEVVVVDRYAALDELKRKGLHHAAAVQSAARRATPIAANETITTTRAADCAVVPTASTIPAEDLAVAASLGGEEFISDEQGTDLPTVPAMAPPQPHAGFHAEKNLTLAEALVRRATAVEQSTVEPPALPDSMFTMLSLPAAASDDPQDVFRSSLPSTDPLAPLEHLETCASSSHPCPEADFDAYECELGSEASPHVVALEDPAWQPVEAKSPFAKTEPKRPSSKPLADQSQPEPVAEEELDLIVVEDDPHTLVIPTTPQVKPVRRQEFRQLFARLRKS